jgi:hypothetical protein
MRKQTYLMTLHTPLAQNLLKNLILLNILAKLILQLLLARRIKHPLLSVLGHQYLPASHHVHHGDAAVGLPLAQLLFALDKDAELVAAAALVEDLGLGGVAAGHGCGDGEFALGVGVLVKGRG